MFSTSVDVLKIIKEDDISNQKIETQSIMRSNLSFEFVIILQLMKSILGITNELPIAFKKIKI